jgi:hypothetical protein
MKTIDNSSAEAKLAYQAFLDMSNSKAAHYNCLTTIDSKYESGGVPSSSEKLELEKLLADHDKNVLSSPGIKFKVQQK